jgi:hypothetical protein
VRIPLALVAALCIPACAGPPAPEPIAGEPICADYEVGATRTKMQGSLRFPVSLVIKEGETLLSRSTLVGLRDPKATKSHALLRDEDAEVTLEWAQCENQRAARAVSAGRDSKDTTAYECGKATVYKTEKLTIHKGDPASRKIQFAEPPDVTCWTGDALPAPAAADAGAPPIVDAGTAENDAGTDTSDAGTLGADAGTLGADAAAPPADAGGAGPGDAGADAGKKKKAPPPPPG